ncbi:hypothetical protein BHE97_14290 [Aeromicrobium sp. PE09-221]|uniref:DUF4190 domain-containing protein n=1 Tax=Aeromicrobium sp. PE09-221 TaxID=1898043 RepID=UPI000B3E77BD|nr:DUF4190 domain-containing protein [Aeromicrobium sp. PE09-221]OUZ08374.1 hypothetical protein BHE97_14290 [Aeromicrobium sp. PE09-221]
MSSAESPTLPSAPGPQSPPPTKNTLGTIALVLALLGFLFACIPGALIVGWVLLPIAFILSLVALFQKRKRHGAAIAGLIVSIVGTVVGVVVFLVVVADAFDDAFTQETTASSSDTEDGGTDSSNAVDEEAGEVGARDNPYPLGTEVASGDWAVTVNTVNLAGNDVIAAENPFNEPPAEGNTFVIVNLTATYVGDDPAGEMPMVIVEYVTSAGNSVNSYDHMAVVPEQFDELSTLYNGASTTGNLAFEIPSEGAEGGVLAVQPDMLSEKVFFAVQ